MSYGGASVIRPEEWAPCVHMWHGEGAGGEEGERKVFAGLITPHEWQAQHRRICYARSSLHTHTHKSRRSSFLSSSLPDRGLCVSAHVT